MKLPTTPAPNRQEKPVLSAERFTALVAQRIFGWKSAPGRFLMENRRWMPAWRFQPLSNLEDAFKLLSASGGTLTLSCTADGCFAAEARVGRHPGRARGKSPAAAVTLAVASAVGVELPEETAEALLR